MAVKAVVPKKNSMIKAIRKMCLSCCCGSSEEVKKCEIDTCELYPYRFGCTPQTYIKRQQKKGTLLEIITQ